MSYTDSIKENERLVKKSWEFIEKFINIEPDALFDMGAGQPNTEAWFCKERWPKCRIIGTEPSVSRRAALISSGYPGELLNIAVGSEMGTLKGFVGEGIYPEPHCGFTLKPSPRNKKFYKPFELKTITLDLLDKEYGSFNNIIVWADIEGSEYKMLCGAKELLKRKAILAILVEVLSVNKHNLKTIKYFLGEYGYEYKGYCKENPQDHIFARG